MASLTIRNLPEDVKQSLRVQAAQAGLSMEAYARNLLQSRLQCARNPGKLPHTHPKIPNPIPGKQTIFSKSQKNISEKKTALTSICRHATPNEARQLSKHDYL